MDAPHPPHRLEDGHPPDDDADRPAGDGVRDRLEALGRISGHLLNDLSDAVDALEARARLAAGEARSGRVPLVGLETVVESSAELSTLLRDVVAALRGGVVSPEVTFLPQPLVERCIRRFLGISRPVEIRLGADLPADVQVHGRASFLARAVNALLAHAARHGRGRVWIQLALDGENDPVVVLTVEDDGPGFDPGVSAARLDAPARSGLEAWDPGLGGAAWAVAQLGGTMRHRPAERLGGACFEVRLPALRVPPECDKP